MEICVAWRHRNSLGDLYNLQGLKRLPRALGVFAVGIVIYFWLQLRPPSPLVNASPPRTAAEAQAAAAPHHGYSLVTVRVRHRYYLTVPFANRLLGRAYLPRFFGWGRAFYLVIEEQYTLVSDDAPLVPDVSGLEVEVVS